MPLDQPDSTSDLSMPLGDHLDELRVRLLWALAGVVVAAVVTFIYGFKLIGWLAQPLLQAQDAMGFSTQTLVFDPTAGFTVYLHVALTAAVLLASPWVIFQGWKFVSVGLYHHERKAVYVLTPFSTAMTALAVLFTYYVLLPVSLLFFFQFATFYPKVELSNPNPAMGVLLDAYGKNGPTVSDEVLSSADTPLPTIPMFRDDPVSPEQGAVWANLSEGKVKLMLNGQVRVLPLQSDKLISPMPALGEYVRFAAIMMLGVTIAFQLPVIMLVAGWTQLFDPRSVAMLRKYALFLAFAAGALLTPTDLLSMVVLAVPLYLLFEFGLLMMKVTYRNTPPPPPEEL